MLDVVVVGGSVAGLSAALYLGRSLRQTVVFDTGEPCNRVSHASHGFWTRDGVAPETLLKIGREQLAPYETVALKPGKVTAIVPQGTSFRATLQGGETVETRKVLLATGLRDGLPAIPNIEPFWGRSVFHCPYCDGWEVRQQPLALYGNGEMALHKAKLLRNLTADLVICTGEPATFAGDDRQRLLAQGIQIIETPVTALEGTGDQLATIHFADGRYLHRRALSIQPKTSQHADLAAAVGCTLTELGLVQVDTMARTPVPGIYAAGEAFHRRLGYNLAAGDCHLRAQPSRDHRRGSDAQVGCNRVGRRMASTPCASSSPYS